jgi:LacI family transcriptional regulator
MPTIHDVAKHAGVGAITVSRVVNHSGYISPEMRARVEQAIAELGYVPNTLARSLRSRRTHTLALIVTDITNPFFTTLARGVEDAASAAGYAVIFCNTDESAEKEARYLQVLLEKRVDGFLLVPARGRSEVVQKIQHSGGQVVVLDRRVEGVAVDTVLCDSQDGAYRLTQHLLGLHHRRIAVISGPQGVSTADDRVAGYRQAMLEAQIGPEEQMVLRGEFTAQSGAALTRQLLALSVPPTALLAANNFMTVGALQALREAGRWEAGRSELGGSADLALAGFDDLPQAMVPFPVITVAAQPAYEMGRLATERLIERLEAQEPLDCRETVLPVEIRIRESTGGPIP